MVYEVTPVVAGEFGLVRDDIKFRGGSPKVQGFVPSYIYLLRRGEDQFLVDTSFPDPAFCEARMGLAVRREKPLPKLLAEKGVVPDRVKGIFFTHLHWDHAGNVGMFPHAALYCQKKEWEAAGDADAYPPEFLQEFRSASGRLHLLDGEEEPVPGIRARLCGGHTPGSQMLELLTPDGPCLITGDVVMTMRNLKKRVPVGLCVDPDEAERALVYVLGRTDCAVLPSHEYLDER